MKKRNLFNELMQGVDEMREREKAKPNTQAALLIKLVAQYPDMVERLEAV